MVALAPRPWWMQDIFEDSLEVYLPLAVTYHTWASYEGKLHVDFSKEHPSILPPIVLLLVTI